MPKTLEFPHARISGIHAKFPGDGKLETYVDVSVELTPDLANMLSCAYLAAEGFEHRVQFEYELKQVKFQLVPNGDLAGRRLTFDSPVVSNFKAIRNGNAIVEFRCEAKASIMTVLDYVLNVGGPLGVLTLTPAQGELFEVPQRAAADPPPAKIITKGAKRVQ